nr:reverse transcriptase domain-containing protein [Tanacetum cinerariifolium]
MATNENDDDVPPSEGGDLPVLDIRTMEELCQPNLNGQGGPIALISIKATNFGLKNDMIQQVQNSFQFHGLSEIVALKAKMAKINKNLMKVLQINQQVKAVTHNCETCGGPHSYNDCPATVGQTQNVYAARAYNQGGNSYQPQGNRNLLSYRTDNYLKPLGFNQNQNRSNTNQKYPNRNQGNNHRNAQGNNQGRNQFFQGASHGQNPPPACQALGYQALVHQAPIPQPNTITNPKEDLKGITTRSGIAYKGPTIPTTSSPLKVVEHETEEVLGFSDVIMSGNPTPYYDLIVSTTSSTLTPLRNSDFLIEEVDTFLAIEDDPTSLEVDQSYLDPGGDILLLEAFLNDDPSLSPPNYGNYLPEVRKELKICEAKSDKSLIDEPLEVELKDLSPHLEYAFLKGDDKLPVITAKDLSVEEKTALITILKSHKRAIAWKLSDIKARPMTCLLENDTPFFFSKECIKAFQTFKKKLTEAPILAAPDWDLPFELICDASDFSIGAENLAADHLSRLENPHQSVLDKKEINEMFPLETLNMVSFHDDSSTPWFADFANYHAANFVVKWMSSQQKNKLFKDVKHYIWDDPFLFKSVRIKSSGGVFMAKKPLKFLRLSIMDPSGDIMARTTPPKRCLTLVFTGPQSIVMPKTWSNLGIDFMRPFPSSQGNKYILVAVDYLSKWFEVKALPTNDARVVCKFLKSFFARFGTPRAIISDHGMHFCNDQLAKVMLKYSVTHRLATAYHPQTSGQVEVSNRGLKRILKRSVGKLKTRSSRPFTITKVLPYGTGELSQTDEPNFKVNGHRLKHYFGEDIPKMVVPDLQTFPKANEFMDWVKLSDPKQALHWRQPMLILVVLMNKCVVWRLASSISRVLWFCGLSRNS